MKKKNKIILITLLIVLAIGYFVYKGINLFMYTYTLGENYEEVVEGLKIKDTMTIKKEVLPEEDYLVFDNIKVKNVVQNFKKIEDENGTLNKYVSYGLYDENEKLITLFRMGKVYFTNLDIFNSTDIETFDQTDNSFTKINRSNIVENNNIKNDIDLIKYLIENKDNKNNIFTSVKKMKENYVIKYFSYNVLPGGEDITLLDGDYIGYIFNIKDSNATMKSRDAAILHNGERYFFTFMWKDNYFDNETINEILNTVIID